MSDSVFLAVLLGVWLLTGLLLAVVLGRRGHDPFGWLVLGTLMGPVAIFLALDAVEHDEQDVVEVVAPPVVIRHGQVDVLVGFDGSPGSKAAVSCCGAPVRRSRRPPHPRHVVPFDAGQSMIGRHGRSCSKRPRNARAAASVSRSRMASRGGHATGRPARPLRPPRRRNQRRRPRPCTRRRRGGSRTRQRRPCPARPPQPDRRER